MMKNVTIQNETLSTTFKEQISSIEADHERSITMLQNQLQASKQEIEQLKNRIETLRQASIDNEKESPPVVVNNDLNKEELPWTYAERQQGEVIKQFFLSNICNKNFLGI
jgi:predicted RNase H-like nuclease (RuvC/YqgF family)